MKTCPSAASLVLRGRRARAQLLAILCVGAVLAGCGAKPDAPPSSSDSGDAAQVSEAHSSASVTASVEVVKVESFTEVVDGSGTVVGRTGHFAALAAPGQTRIAGVHVTLGKRVNRGDRLVSFETTTFDAAVATADAALNAAELAAARAKRLVDAGVAPRKDAEAAAADLAAAQSASVNAHRDRQLAELVSPIGGVVTRLDAVLGANVDVAQTLVEVTDTQALDVLLVLSPSLAAKVSAGQAVVFRSGAATDADTIATGRVADVSAAIDADSRGVPVRIAIGSQSRTLRLGESLYGQIQTQVHRNALVIPDDALVPAGDGFQVFVVDSSETAHATAVTIGARSGHRVWIVDGLKAGDRVITVGAFGVDDGATVLLTKAKP